MSLCGCNAHVTLNVLQTEPGKINNVPIFECLFTIIFYVNRIIRSKKINKCIFTFAHASHISLS